jgi:cell division septum initiation protein DivIVA
MTDEALRRADDLLTELVELVETARTVPMSSSCVLPREHVLDLLDGLRETLPPEIEEARRVVANRDGMLHDAFTEASEARERASAEAETITADARHRSDELVHDAEVRAYEIVEDGKAEHARLVSATGVHQAAAKAAAELREGAEAYDLAVRQQADEHEAQLRADAERYATEVRADAERYAEKLTVDADAYADRTLSELADTLHRAAATAEQGRTALARRREQLGQRGDYEAVATANPAPGPTIS